MCVLCIFTDPLPSLAAGFPGTPSRTGTARFLIPDFLQNLVPHAVSARTRTFSRIVVRIKIVRTYIVAFFRKPRELGQLLLQQYLLFVR